MYRFDNAIIDGHGHVCFPDRRISIDELKGEFIDYKFRVIFGAKYTIAIENSCKVIVGWMNVNTLGFEDVLEMIRVQLKLKEIIG